MLSVVRSSDQQKSRMGGGHTDSGHLISGHGGILTELIAEMKRQEEIRGASRNWLSWDLTPRRMCDVELLLNGAFSPLRGFMDRTDCESVCQSMRLAGGTLWPIPVTLDAPEELTRKLNPGATLALRDPRRLTPCEMTGSLLAVSQAPWSFVHRTACFLGIGQCSAYDALIRRLGP